MLRATRAWTSASYAPFALLSPAPLVLHGSSGVADANLVWAVACGITKVNIATHLNNAFTVSVREYLAAHPAAVDTRAYLGVGLELPCGEVTRLLGVLRTLPVSRNRHPLAASGHDALGIAPAPK